MGKDGLKQFFAVTGKNFILQTRSRKSFLGLGGWGALLIQLLLPVAFFLVMYLPKHYIKPTRHGETMGWAPVQLESRSWAQPYDGPAVYPESGGRAWLLLAPDTPRVRGLARALARTLACPRDPAKRTCPVPNLPPNFHCMFMPPPQPKPQPSQPAQAVADATMTAETVGDAEGQGELQQRETRVEGARARAWEAAGRGSQGAQRFLGWGWGLPWSGGAQGVVGLERGTEEPRLETAEADPCADFATCVSTPACYEHVFRDQMAFMASEEAARRNVTEEPEVYDALLVFPGEVAPRREGETGEVLSRRSGATGEAPGYWGHSGREGYEEGQGDQKQQLAAGREQQQAQEQEGAAADSSPLRSLSRVVVSMNHTDVPPTQLILDQFEVVPTRGNGLALYKRYWFLTNLQLALGRTLMGLHVAMHTTLQPPPPPPSEEPPASNASQGMHRISSGPGSVRTGLYGARGSAGGGGTDIPDELYDTAVPVDVAVSYKAFPWPSVTEDLGAASAAVFFNLLLVYAFLAPTRAVVGDIVREKELRLREGMRILGLSEPAYWGSWALTHWLLLAASGALCAAAGAYPFSNSSTLVMLGFFWLYGAALVSYSYAMSTLFSSIRVAGTASQLLYALSMLPGFLMPATFEYGSWLWYASCLLPPSAASLFAAALVNWEKVAQGITPRTLWSPITAATPFSAGTVLSFLAFDVLFYAVLTWYLDKVMPKSYGQRLPWWFVFDARYWTRNARRTNRRRRGRSTSQPPDGGGGGGGGALTPLLPRGASADGRSANGGDIDGGGGGDAAGAGDAVEAGAGAGAAVEVRGLCKEFPTPAGGGVKVAVDHLDMRIDRGRITALLGHNGAGKTTTIHILTGMLQPTSGTATVNGYDIAHQMDKVRSSLGVCPQFDILWPDLTVLEHLRLYADIKGYGRQEREQVAVRAAEEVGLASKLHCGAGELSGGQRRKLSVAIAFLGDPAVVFLDEPTSGMDPYSRRFTWDIIRRHRSASAVVLTTHSMEEADLLGDRIIIMARGRVAAAGSSMELKSSVGVGYNLTLVMQQPNDAQNPPSPHPHTPATNGTSPSSAAGPASPPTSAADTACSHVSGTDASSAAAAAALALARRHVPCAELLSAAGAEVVLRLPREAAGAFPPLLRALAGAEGRAAGVASFGLSVTTLEEVFLSITAAAERDQPTDLTAQAAAAAADRHAPFPGAAFPSPSSGLPSPSKTPTPPPLPDQPPHLTASPSSPSPSSPPSPPSGTGATAAVPVQPLRGWRLYGSQLRALLTKRALCARRDRLAVVTQLAVPLALVYLALWISALQVREPSQPPLELSRAACLLGRPLPASASPRARNATWDPVSNSSTSLTRHQQQFSAAWQFGQQQKEQRLLQDPQPLLPLFLSGYPPDSGIHDSGATALYTGDPKVPRSSTLESFLLKRWFGGNKYGSPSYDAVHLDELPSPYDVASGRGRLSLVLLTNQSAVSALPAAVSELLTAALSYIDRGLQPPPPQQQPIVGTATSVSVPVPGEASGAAEAVAGDPASRRAYGRGTSPLHRRLRGTTAINSTDTASSQFTESTFPPSASTASASPSPPFSFSFVSRPLPTLPSEPVVQVQRDAASLMLALCMTLAASVLSASFVVFLVREQDNNSKHLQLVSGAPPTAYWAANYLWDLLAFSGSAAGIVGLVAAYRLPQFSGQRLAAVAGLLWGFGGAGLSMTYMLHFLFKDEMRALQRLNTLYFLTGYLGFVATWVMDLILLLARPAGLAAWNDGVKGVLRTASPHYCFARGVYDVQATYGTGFPFFPRGKPFDWDVFGSPMVHMAVQAVVYGAIAVLYDTGMTAALHSWLQSAVGQLQEAVRAAWAGARRRGGDAGGGARDVEAAPLSLRRALLGEGEREGAGGTVGGTVPAAELGAAASERRLQQQQDGRGAGHRGGAVADGDGNEEGDEDEDEDVTAERQAVQAGWRTDSQVLLDGVRKSYSQGPFRPPVRAVRGLWVGVPRGECFGLLGVNGAGKTTTFRMLTGEVLPDAGDALVGGHSVRRALGAARRQLGYCPQFEALPGAMTGREVLAMYARLRGVPERHVRPLVGQLLRRVGLEGAAEALCGAYSGGMKRKLGVAVALAGDPRVTALDEPSTGMDPGARRALWTCLQTEVIQAGRTVILTSHSMEECEALASRLTIMTAGRLRCLGTVQHLKSRFGQGYVLEIKTLPRSASALSLDAVPQRGTAGPAGGAVAAAGGARRASGGGVGALAVGSAAASAAGGAARISSEGVGGAAGGEGDAPRLLQWLQGVCPGASLLQRDENRYTFSVPRSSGPGCAPLDLAGLFEEVERHRQHLGVVDYCLTQTTLEQVFIALAGQQHSHEHGHQ